MSDTNTGRGHDKMDDVGQCFASQNCTQGTFVVLSLKCFEQFYFYLKCKLYGEIRLFVNSAVYVTLVSKDAVNV